MKILIDFEDSFTFNLLQLFDEVGVKLSVVHWRDLSSIDYSDLSLVVLGPGPGHPDDYKTIYDFINKILVDTSVYVFGVCLGHQLILSTLGHCVRPLRLPFHGVAKKIKLNNFFSKLLKQDEIVAQFYNSLVPINSQTRPASQSHQYEKQVKDKWIIMVKGDSFFSCQFHLESVGTPLGKNIIKKIL